MSDAAYLTAQGLNVDLAGRAVLHDIALSLSRQRLVALVGPNGAGKTTLLRALAGLLPSSGRIDVDGDALSCTGRCRRATWWRWGVIRTARPIRRGSRRAISRR
jgi:iron complex transport system ATP-binding protein